MAESREFRFGEGRISGVLSLTLGALGLGGVACLLWPDVLTTPELRSLYPMPWVRGTIQAGLVAAVAFGLLNAVLGHGRRLGVAGIVLATLATVLGGSDVAIEGPVDGQRYVGLDWFLLNLLVLALVFVPLERAFALRREQRIFRRGWRTDLAHFFASHLMVQVTVLLTMIPAALFFRWAVDADFQRAVGAQPLWLQALEALFLADLFAYGAHRLFHAVPVLWRFHAVHHSCEELDWLASSRLHLVDIVVTRAIAFVPLYLMGFSPAALYPYLVFASVQGIFVHSNLRFDFGPLRWLLVTPRFHHWHHTAEPHAVDRNFAAHLPLIDWIFGTYYLPDERWPARYGIEGRPVPDGWLRQLLYPFRP